MRLQKGNRGTRNGEGYLDPTAAAALRNIGGGSRKEKAMKFYAGDIWECSENSGALGTCAVISAHKKYATVLWLVATQTEDTPYRVLARGEMFTDPGRVSFVMYDRLQNFVRAMSEAEVVGLREAVREALEFPTGGAEGSDITEEQAEELKAKAQKAESRAIELEKKVQNLFDELQEAKKQADGEGKMELVKAQTQRDLYKSLYEETLDKMIDMT